MGRKKSGKERKKERHNKSRRISGKSSTYEMDGKKVQYFNWKS
jgi:hypothetical protein